MSFVIRAVEHRTGKTYRAYYDTTVGGPGYFEVYAQDELAAFNAATEILKKGEARVRTAIICLTVSLLAGLSSVTYSCQQSRATYAASMRECAKFGKSFVSEGDRYSCRDANVKVGP